MKRRLLIGSILAASLCAIGTFVYLKTRDLASPESILARLPSDGTPDRDDWAVLSSAWRERVDARIAELERLRDGLTECIGCGCLSLDRCRFANPGDAAGRAGPGPRYWVAGRP